MLLLPMIGDTQLAWAAGLFDGEGNICIDRRIPRAKAGERTIRYRLRIRVAMTHYETVMKMQQLFGLGSIQSRKRYKTNEADQIVWVCDSQAAYTVLRLMLPYLFTKLTEAQIGIAFYEYNKAMHPPGRNGSSPKVIEKRDEYYQQLRQAKVAHKRYRNAAGFSEQRVESGDRA